MDKIFKSCYRGFFKHGSHLATIFQNKGTDVRIKVCWKRGFLKGDDASWDTNVNKQLEVKNIKNLIMF